MRNTYHKRAIGLFGAIFLAIFALCIFTYLFIIIQKKNINISAISIEVYKLNQSLKEQSNIKKTLEITEGERDQLSSYFVSGDSVVSFIERIEGYALKTNTTIVISSVDIDEDLKVLNLTLSTSGSFQDLYQLLVLLENAPVEFQFVSTSFSKVGPSGASAPESLQVDDSSVWSAEFDINLISFEL